MMIIRMSDRLKSQKFRRLCELRRRARIRSLFMLLEENLHKSLTGLPYDLWIDGAGNERNVQHNKPRLKVKVNGELIPVSMGAEPSILPKNKKIPKFGVVRNWIANNNPWLMRYWNREISHDDFIESLFKK